MVSIIFRHKYFIGNVEWNIGWLFLESVEYIIYPLLVLDFWTACRNWNFEDYFIDIRFILKSIDWGQLNFRKLHSINGGGWFIETGRVPLVMFSIEKGEWRKQERFNSSVVTTNPTTWNCNFVSLLRQPHPIQLTEHRFVRKMFQIQMKGEI